MFKGRSIPPIVGKYIERRLFKRQVPRYSHPLLYESEWLFERFLTDVSDEQLTYRHVRQDISTSIFQTLYHGKHIDHEWFVNRLVQLEWLKDPRMQIELSYDTPKTNKLDDVIKFVNPYLVLRERLCMRESLANAFVEPPSVWIPIVLRSDDYLYANHESFKHFCLFVDGKGQWRVISRPNMSVILIMIDVLIHLNHKVLRNCFNEIDIPRMVQHCKQNGEHEVSSIFQVLHECLPWCRKNIDLIGNEFNRLWST